MPLKIVILEDNADRRSAMQVVLAGQLPTYESIFFDDVAPMLAWFDEHFEDVLIVSLDHDLDLIPTPEGKLRDPGDGRMVSQYLARRQAAFPVVVHSTNTIAVASMSSDLEDAGVPFAVVTPYADTTWIEEAWRHLIRQMLLEHSNVEIDWPTH